MSEITNNPVETKKYPFFVKATVIMAGLVLLFYVFHLLSSVLVPFGFACLIAILLNPLSNRMQRKLPRGIAIFLAILVAILAAGALLYFLSTQILAFRETLPALKTKSQMILVNVETWVNLHFGIANAKQMEMINNALHARESGIGETLSTILNGIASLILIPIYVFFLLFYKPLILDFIFQVFREKYSLRVAEILGETKTAIQRYIIGLLTEMAIVSAMNSIALLALGVRSAILIGVIGGILNTIPYLGGIIAIALPMMMATVTKDGYSVQLAILACYLVIQLIDNNVLIPKIVSSKVQINALFSILAVLCGGLLAGYSGMFLAIPVVAIIKIIFDRIDGLKPWGHLLGTTIPEVHAGVKWQARWQLIFIRKKQRAAEYKIEESKTPVIKSSDEG